MSARERSPRPAETLPPTLLPNPVLMAAPRPDRVASLLVACVVYCALGAAVAGGSRHLGTGSSAPVTHEYKLQEPGDPPAPPVAQPQRPAATGSVRPAAFKTVAHLEDSNAVPVDTPKGLDLQDRSLLIASGPVRNGGLLVAGASEDPGPALEPGPVHPVRVLEIDFREVRILRQVSPVYPALARLLKAQGAVELRMTIDAQGVPTAVEVISGPHPLLINEALRVARLWRFQPAMADGQAVTASFRLTVGFRLSS